MKNKFIRSLEYDWYFSNYKPVRYVLGFIALCMGIFMMLHGFHDHQCLPTPMIEIMEPIWWGLIGLVGGLGTIFQSSMLEILFMQRLICLKKKLSHVSDVLIAFLYNALALGFVFSGTFDVSVLVFVCLAMLSLYVIYRKYSPISRES